jgi:hypothetical protein
MKIVRDNLGREEIVGDHSGDGFVGCGRNGRISGNQQAFVGNAFVGNAFIGSAFVGAARRKSSPFTAVLTYRGGTMRFTASSKSEAVTRARDWATQRRVPKPYSISGDFIAGVAGCTIRRVPGTGPKASSPAPFTKLAVLGLIFDSAEDAGTFSAPRPTKYETVVYRLRRRRISGTYFWDREDNFIEDGPELAAEKAKAYIAKNNWLYVPFVEDASKAAGALAQSQAAARALAASKKA